MNEVIMGISSFLVTGAIMVIGAHIGFSFSRLQAGPRQPANDLEKIAHDLGTHMAAPAPTGTPRFESPFRSTFSGFDSPPGRF